jgi:hypothetical protein
VVAVNAAKEKTGPQNDTGCDQKFSGNMPLDKRHAAGLPEDVDVHQCDN